MSAMPISWHCKNLVNVRLHLEQREAELSRIEHDVDRLRTSCKFRVMQIDEAKRQGKDKFDGDRFLANKRDAV